MCGIAGYWSFNKASSEILSPILRHMSGALTHRGPDSSGFWLDSQVPIGIAHQRLAVIDLSVSGSQPMISETDRFCISFNGEIYNHLELRKSLDKSWCGSSDTETLLAAIECWGLEETLARTSGMFAFALWDRSNRTLRLVRDRFGEKPLYWGVITHDGESALVFSSELAAIKAIPGLAPLQISHSALSSYFTYGCVSAPHSIYQGIQQLQPGSLLTFISPSAPPSSATWWDPIAECLESNISTADSFSCSEYIDQLDSLLNLVVSQCSLSDVPFGSFLSGGIDSSLVAALLQANSSTPVNTFTISFPEYGHGEASFDEAAHASRVASYLGTVHTEVALSPNDVFSLIPQLPSIYSEPFADSSQVPTHLVCREAKRSGLTVALSGDGGDELFGGYNRHRIAPQLHNYLSLIPPFLRSALSYGVSHFPILDNGLSLDKRDKLASAIRSGDSLHSLYNALLSLRFEFNSLFTHDFLSDVQPHEFDFASIPHTLQPSEQLMLADSITYLPNDILVKVDRAAMSASFETRAPFLDHRLAKYAWKLPVSMKVRDGVGKWALREVLRRYLPAKLFDRPKAGFAMPLGPWLRGPLRSWANDLLDPSLIKRDGVLNSLTVQRLWHSHLSGADHTSKLWTVLMWQAWATKWLAS